MCDMLEMTCHFLNLCLPGFVDDGVFALTSSKRLLYPVCWHRDVSPSFIVLVHFSLSLRMSFTQSSQVHSIKELK